MHLEFLVCFAEFLTGDERPGGFVQLPSEIHFIMFQQVIKYRNINNDDMLEILFIKSIIHIDIYYILIKYMVNATC